MSYNNNNNSSNNIPGRYRRTESNASNRSNTSRRGSSSRRLVDRSNVPVEQGIICSLKDSFGFIHCAERPEEIFFHYSEVMNCHPDELQVDTEVEFKVGPSEKDSSKQAAYEVTTVPTGTVVWETEEEPEKFFEGLVERHIRTDGRGGGNTNNSSSNNASTDGSIQVLITDSSSNSLLQDDENAAESTTSSGDKKGGPLVRFRAEDYNPDNKNSRNAPNRLFRGDLVRFRILTDRRTKQKYARYITLLQTEKERARIEKEQKLLASATEEEGVVISLNKGYGFLKSTKRREHVYFHYSNVENTEEGFELKKGQEMKFLVVTETIDGQCKYSARKLECLPHGSVVFHIVVAKGVKGIVSLCPLPPSSSNPGYADDKDGAVQLIEPIVDNESTVTEVSLLFSDVPGGVYTFQQRGSAVNGLWILEGDTLLFDVVKDLGDGSYRAEPTLHTLGLSGVVKEPLDAKNEESARIRIVACSLVSRAEGTLHTLKVSGGYGFIHFAERPIDVHFHTFNLMPDELQVDLRKQLGYDEDVDVKLEVGAGVHFDICAHGMVSSGPRGGRQKKASPHERENVKAHRIVLLPPSGVVVDKVIATGVQGVIKSADAKQLYAGFVDLDADLEPISLRDRHPLVAQMIESFLEESGRPHGRKSLVFRDILSVKDDDVVVQMVKMEGKGLLSYNHIPVAGMDAHPGRLCIRRLADDEAPKEEDTKPQSAKKKQNQNEPNKNLRFDKSSLSEAAKEELPPGPGDIITCDILQNRRTGKFVVSNLKIAERKAPDAVSEGRANNVEAPGVGVVQNVVPKSNFGFISVLDENATRRELLFFSLSNDKQGRKVNFRKGDEVKFSIGVDSKTGKRMATNVQILPKGSIPSQPAKNACKGIILMEPTHTRLSDTPLRKKHSSDSGSSGRWGNVKDDNNKNQQNEVEKGYILLLEDSTGMFSKKGRAKVKRHSPAHSSEDEDAKSVEDDVRSVDSADDMSVDSADTSGDDAKSVDTTSTDGDDYGDLETGALLTHLSYKNGAIAIHGSGSSTAIDSSSNPRRGDLVSFVKSKSGKKGVRDIRVVTRQAATLVRGRLENIIVERSCPGKNAGKAKFIAATEKEEAYEISLKEVVSCDAALLKENQAVEGILHDGRIFGVCRTSDLYLESKLGTSHKERPKLNLAVRKNLGGTIIAQSMMAKGPDGTTGFAVGWTTRTSQYKDFQNQETG